MFSGYVSSVLRSGTRRQKLALRTAVHSAVSIVGLLLAVLLRFDFTWDPRFSVGTLIQLSAWLVALRFVAYSLLKVDNRSWRYFSAPDALLLGKAHVITTAMMMVVVTVLPFDFFPRSILLIELILSLLSGASIRLLARFIFEEAQQRELNQAARNDVIVLGAGTSGHLVVKTICSQKKMGFKVVAVLDDNQYLWGATVHGAPVVGPLSQLREMLETNPSITSVVLAIPSLERSRFDALRDLVESFEISFKSIQSFEDIACHEVVEPKTRRTIEQILERETVDEHEDEILEALQGRRILVTGAGGSIGSEIVRQVLGFEPKSVVLLDQSEYALFSMRQELRENFAEQMGNQIFVIADISNRERMERVFREHQPEIVLHAAAYKHVPLMEANCYEAFNTNVVGTRNLLELSAEHGADRFVLISTDKAVDPSSVMGSSKRVAEMMVEAFGSRTTQERVVRSNSNLIELNPNNNLSTAAVRFGNVINSSGSVIPTFKKQILAGRPITVTHPEITRYFMSIKQAVRLVLTAGTLGQRGEIYLLDMGTPIKIVDVARKLRALYGRRDVPIRFTGLREGEKLYESLVSKIENVRPSQFTKINIVNAAVDHEVDIFDWIEEFKAEIPHLKDREIGERLRAFVLTLQKTDREVIEEHSYRRASSQ